MRAPSLRVWRIEHPKDRIGPFLAEVNGQVRPHVRSGRPAGDWVCPTDMPTLSRDRLLRDAPINDVGPWFMPVDSIKFAYPTARELLRWWSGWSLMRLTEHGYVVRLLQVPWSRCRRYRAQVVYDETYTTVLREMAPAAVMWCAPGPVPESAKYQEYRDLYASVSNWAYASF